MSHWTDARWRAAYTNLRGAVAQHMGKAWYNVTLGEVFGSQFTRDAYSQTPAVPLDVHIDRMEMAHVSIVLGGSIECAKSIMAGDAPS